MIHLKSWLLALLLALITSVSNAAVKRMFYLVPQGKTIARNTCRMQQHLLDAIERIRAELLLSNKCYKNFVVTCKILMNFRSDWVYISVFQESVNDDDNAKLFL